VGKFPFSRQTNTLFGRIGEPRAGLKFLHDEAVPVVLVDTFQDDEADSIQCLTGFPNGSGIAPQKPGMAIGSTEVDWFIHEVAIGTDNFSAVNREFHGVHLFAVSSADDPVAIGPSALQFSGLRLNPNFTLGNVFFRTGLATVTPSRRGLILMQRWYEPVDNEANNDITYFNPPMRVPRGYTIGIQQIGFTATAAGAGFTASVLYHERSRANRTISDNTVGL